MKAPHGFTNGAFHVAMPVLFSNVSGWLFREWKGASVLPKRVLPVGMAVIVVVALIIFYGNCLGESSVASL